MCNGKIFERFFNLPDKPLFLAPMSELTHYPFRKLIEEIGGVDILYTEMLSAEQIVYQGVKKSIFLKCIECYREKPLIFQLLGNNPEILKKAAEILIPLGADGIDLNLGCSAPFVYKKGKGSGLLMDMDMLEKTLCSLRDIIKDISFSVKMRLGDSLEKEEFLNLVEKIVMSGVDFLVIHPRLIKEKFKRRARWEYIECVKKEFNIDVVGNGDISDYHVGVKRLSNPYVDGVMIGRAALSNPFVFKEIKFRKELKKDYRGFFLKYIEYVKKFLPEEIHLKRVKLFSKWFTIDIPFGHFLWKEINNCGSLFEIEKIIFDYL